MNPAFPNSRAIGLHPQKLPTGDYFVSNQVNHEILALPLHSMMRRETVNRVIRTMAECFAVREGDKTLGSAILPARLFE